MYKPRHAVKKPRLLQRLRRARTGTAVFLLLLAVLATASVGGVWAYLIARSATVTNTFVPSKVEIEPEEEFDGTVKKNVTVRNTGDTDVYVRIRLVTYRVNEAGQPIGGAASIPEFTPGSGWVNYYGYYYYTKPVAPGKAPDVPLIGGDGITLQKYTDEDGGKQVIEVLGEAIQSDPAAAAGEAWGVAISESGVAPYPTPGGDAP